VIGILPPEQRTRQYLFLAISTTAAFAVLLAAATTAEERDAFCIACHTNPEQTYYDRAQSTVNGQNPVDLSSAHYAGTDATFRCIDCHRGESTLPDRAATLALGARDALIFLTGRADPAIEKLHSAAPELTNRACVHCHIEALIEAGFNNHFHNKLFAAKEVWAKGGAEVSPEQFGSSVACADCHRAHVSMEAAQDQFFLDVEGAVYPVCVKCHEEMGKGPVEALYVVFAPPICHLPPWMNPSPSVTEDVPNGSNKAASSSRPIKECGLRHKAHAAEAPNTKDRATVMAAYPNETHKAVEGGA